ncbi:MAG: SRPBCC family protein [Gemmatimonadales bacterium]|nr:SRPBCC family protein [Gemmatimonadales bacterium]
MRDRIFVAWQWVPSPLERTFSFFADAHNLERITPPFVKFRIVTPPPIEMRVGTLIDYRLRLHGIPLRWRSEITHWDPPRRFIDEQRRGPYRKWIHEHRFEAEDGGTRVEDHVTYAVPGGALIDRWFVRPDLKRIFEYRHSAISEVLGR